ncbi:N-acetylmuramoyl-L-alanine amidase [Adlercreutzia sp. ZJ473]|uniref:N-acetylmuramoyl-L-alanine amidase n=1 Tax=Adlercreutzia sp. ZJ473 TaxID=2722822 RepID=UPI001551733A|nr:N-acetylmuramoyl-L-alanine amidase [Adlercreutzia sp. ZJ473]
MTGAKKTLSFFLSFVLAFSLMGVPAYADEVVDRKSPESGQKAADEGLSRSSEADKAESAGEKADTTAGEKPEGKAEGGGRENPAGASSSAENASAKKETAPKKESSEEEPKADEAQQKAGDQGDPLDDATVLTAEEAVEFVYIENNVVSLGEEQNIAIGLLTKGGSVDKATLELVKGSSHEKVSLDASAITEGAVLFTASFDDPSSATSYLMSRITFESAGERFAVDFGDSSISSVSVSDEDTTVEVVDEVDSVSSDAADSGKVVYAFDVVSPELAEALTDAADKGEDGVSVLALGDDGSVVAKSSIEEAVQTADAEGVASVSEGDSVVVEDPGVEASEEAASEEVGAGEAAAEEDGAGEAASEEAGADEIAVEGDSADEAAVEAVDDVEAVEGDNADGEEGVEADDEVAADLSVAEPVYAGEGPTDEDPDQSSDSEADADLDAESEEPKSLLDTVIGFFANLFGFDKAWAAVSSARENYLVVAIDPGHGGYDGGASGNGLAEKDVNLSIAKHFQQELSSYTGVSAHLTRSSDVYVGLQQRVDSAVSVGADVFVSVHCNSSSSSAAYGAEVWVPNNSSYLNAETHKAGADLGNKILSKLTALGLSNRGVQTRDCTNNERYPDGSLADYYTVINGARWAGIPGIIVEHAFISNPSDAAKYLGNDAARQKLGVADATGVAQKYSLIKDSAAKASSLVSAKAHVANLGWESTVYDGKVAGTTGKGFGLEAFQLNLQNAAASSGGITYRSNVGGSWQGWVSNGATSGTTGKGKALQAVQINLTGAAASKYDVYYRVHVANVGWLGWAKNGASAGSVGYGYNAEALEVVIVSKGGKAPGSTATPFMRALVTYKAHVQNIGWQSAVSDGAVAGTSGRSLRVEALQIDVNDPECSGDIQARAHVQNIGWQNWTSGLVGTTGKSLRVEALQIKLTGEIAQKYDVYYRTHVQNIGWTGWAKNGASSGSQGYSYRMEAVQIKLVKKGGAAPGSTSGVFYPVQVSYQTHVQNVGWQSMAYNGAVSGTTGRSLRLEGINISLGSAITDAYKGGIQYRTHVQNIGWESGWKSNGATSGTTGRSLRLEAIQIRLTGDVANQFDVYYRVHAQNFGWMGWAKNGESAGTEGYSYRLEGIQIKLVKKGGTAPGSTSNAFKDAYAYSIMGSSQASARQMVAYFKSMGKPYPSVYASKGASSIEQYCKILCEEAQAEGVRAEVLFCQAMKETGWLQFGGDVKAGQCNFGGLGATGGVKGATFPDVRTGLRAQVQHLKAYASTAPLKNACVDPRFGLVKRGSAPEVTDLNGKWAVPGTNYGQDIVAMIRVLKRF